MKHIQNKLLSSFTIISIIPVIAIGLFSYYTSAEAFDKKMVISLMSTLEQININVEQRQAQIEKYMDLLFTSPTVHEMLRTTDFSVYDNNTRDAKEKLDAVFTSSFYKDADIRSAILFSNLGGYYNYIGYIDNADSLKETEWYRNTVENNGKSYWGGIIKHPLQNPNIIGKNETSYYVGRVIKNTTKDSRDFSPLGVVCVFIDPDTFSKYRNVGIYSEENVSEGIDTVIADDRGTIISGDRLERFKTLSDYGLQDDIMHAGTGNFRRSIDGVDSVVFYTTSDMGWKIIQLVPYDYFTGETRNILKMTLIICISCLFVITILAYLISRAVSNPIKHLVSSMKRVGSRDFSALVPITQKDEIGLICRGFNDMVEQIEMLFNTVTEKEKQKRREEIRKLQYQINPHFLYNTLGSIRFVAIAQKADIIGDMIQVLSRLLRNTIRKADSMIPACEEINNLKDYIYLQQIRYKNRIGVSYDVENSIMNCKIPGMLLQPLVENSIMHGLSDRLNTNEGPAVLVISGYKTDESIVFELYDNGKGISECDIQKIFSAEKNDENEKDEVHIGIKNIHDRIRLQFGEQYGIKVESSYGVYTKIVIVLPLIENEGSEYYA